MREIIPGLLWIGNAADARNPSELHEQGIRAVVDLAFEHTAPQLTRDLVHCRFPLVDGAGNPPGLVRIAIDTVVAFLRMGMPTLVACGAGMSRSPAVAAAALARFQNRDVDACLQEIVANRPHDVSPSLWREVYAAFVE